MNYKYYLKTREDGAIIDAWSDGPSIGRNTTGYIQFGEGGYQFRFIINNEATEENPRILNNLGIPLYKYIDGMIQYRTQEEINADIALLPSPTPSPIEQLRADVDFIMVMTNLE